MGKIDYEKYNKKLEIAKVKYAEGDSIYLDRKYDLYLKMTNAVLKGNF